MKFLLQTVKPIVEKYPLIAKLYRYTRDCFYIRKKVKSVHGFYWQGNKTMSDGSFEPNELKLVQKIFSFTDLFINIGANQGIYVCHALDKNIKVLAFEPDPINFEYLINNVTINDWTSNVEAFPCAVGNKNCLNKLYGSDTGASLIEGWAGNDSSKYQLIPTIKLDYFIRDDMKNKQLFFLIDIEGSENEMLEGAKSFIKLDLKPIWMIEIAIYDHQPIKNKINPNLISTFNKFYDQGYKAFTADENLREIKLKEIIKISNYQADPNLALSRNFLFVDENRAEEYLNLFITNSP